ncbi:MAG: trypsin-like peptidase domain-containing protein [Acholeplasmataceae bacterium]|nr:trypsin-like peptidase domain-containing protein [Acholeplasmataceae bacterium]
MKKLLIVFLIFILAGCQKIDQDELKEEIKNEILEEMQSQIVDFNEQLKLVSSQAKSCTIVVEITLPDESKSHGSGVIYEQDSNDYYVITNEHVIRYYQSIEVYLPNQDRYLSASFIKSDPSVDLAILKITSAEILDICELEPVNYMVGELVLSIGTPVDLDYVNTVTLGIISKIEDDLIQHDAAVNPGSSGGPLFNLEGQIIGINVSKLNSTNSGGSIVTVIGIGFSIPIEVVLEFIES